MKRRSNLLAVLVIAILSAGVVACDEDDAGSSPEGTFVGKVEGTDAYIALVSDGEQVGGYICDSKQVSTWIDASELSGGSGELVARSGDRLGEATLTDEGASGEVTVLGQSRPFSADLATGEAGLYREGENGGDVAVVGNVETAWIVLDDGSERGAKTEWIDPNTDPRAPKTAPKFTGQEQPWISPDIDP